MNIQAKEIKNYIRIVVVGVIILILVLGSFTIVGAGHVGVVTRLGAVNRVVDPGMIFKIPLIESVTQMETRTQKEQVDAAAASKDLQEVKYRNINRFPTLLIQRDGAPGLLVTGYRPAEVLINIINEYKRNEAYDADNIN